MAMASVSTASLGVKSLGMQSLSWSEAEVPEEPEPLLCTDRRVVKLMSSAAHELALQRKAHAARSNINRCNSTSAADVTSGRGHTLPAQRATGTLLRPPVPLAQPRCGYSTAHPPPNPLEFYDRSTDSTTMDTAMFGQETPPPLPGLETLAVPVSSAGVRDEPPSVPPLQGRSQLTLCLATRPNPNTWPLGCNAAASSISRPRSRSLPSSICANATNHKGGGLTSVAAAILMPKPPRHVGDVPASISSRVGGSSVGRSDGGASLSSGSAPSSRRSSMKTKGLLTADGGSDLSVGKETPIANLHGGTFGGLPSAPPISSGAAGTRQSSRRQRRRSRSLDEGTLSSRVLQRSCPVCYCDLTPATLETFGCGVHICCGDCITRSAELQVRSGVLPKCFHPGCGAAIDPLVAMRLLGVEDHERYLHLALWSNPRVEACPQCRAFLFSDSVPPRGSSATCPSCKYNFCTECRCLAHPGTACEVALKQHMEEEMQGTMKKSSSKDPTLRSIAAQSNNGTLSARGQRSLPSSAADWTSRDLERFAHRNGWKVCPRCRAIVEKADESSCDHMICAQCQHEFCWSCLADRNVIYAHGNHFHRPGCRFYAPYDGPDEYLPNRCVRCALRGSSCGKVATAENQPNAGHSAALVVGQYYTVLVDACVQWLRTALGSGTRVSNEPRRQPAIS